MRDIGADLGLGFGIRDHPEIDDRNIISLGQQGSRIQTCLCSQLPELVKADQAFERRMVFVAREIGGRALKKSAESGPTILACNDRQHPDRTVVDQLPLARPETRYAVTVIQRRAWYQHQFSGNGLGL